MSEEESQSAGEVSISSLQHGDSLFEALLQLAPDSTVIVDNSGAIVWVNVQTEKLFGYSRGELLGQPIETLIPERFHAKHPEHIKSFFRNTGYRPMGLGRELYGVAKNGDEFPVEISLGPAETADGTMVMASVRDATARKQVEREINDAKTRAEDATKARDAFLAAMSHEIRTPMNGVMGMLELLGETPLSSEQHEIFDIIQDSSSTLLTVINEILDFSKIEAGKLEIEMVELSVLDIVESVADLTASSIKSKPVDVSTYVCPAIDDILIGDPVRLRQILTNFMSNAVKFTDSGTVVIKARTVSVDDESMMVRFEVADTGIGMNEQQIEKLFQPFSQADVSTTRRFGGSGLGLAICQRLSSMMGGTVGVDSALGKGSTFWFELPFKRANGQQSRFKATFNGLRILCCTTPKLAVHNIVKEYLTVAGAEVVRAFSVEEVVDLLIKDNANDHPFDAVLVRYNFGGTETLELTTALAQQFRFNEVPLILHGPKKNATAREIFDNGGFADWLTMPLRRESLLDSIARVTNRAAPEGEVYPDEDDANNAYQAPTIEQAVENNTLILVAEDNRVNQMVIQRQLNRLGFTVELANDGVQALDMLNKKKDRYGLMITDCHMPFMDGYELTQRWREQESRSGKLLPIVALTANALQGEADRCKAAGMDDYLSKPVELANLEAVIIKWLPKAAEMRVPIDKMPMATELGRRETDKKPINLSTAVEIMDAPTIDRDCLARILGTDSKQVIDETLNFFWETMADTPRELLQHIENKNATDLRNAAHAAKGSSASAGAAQISKIMGHLQIAAETEDWVVIKNLEPLIQKAFSDVEQYIQSLND